MTEVELFSIGHSNHTTEKFIELLEIGEVDMVVDVRSAPFSKMFPQFNQPELKESLQTHKIGYLFLGDLIGGRSDSELDYVDGQVNYERVAQKGSYKLGIERVMKGLKSFRIALMCSEREPLECHRALLVSQSLTNNGISVGHILADGIIEPHDQALLRLLKMHGLESPDLFSEESDRLKEALKAQEKKVAFRLREKQPDTLEAL